MSAHEEISWIAFFEGKKFRCILSEVNKMDQKEVTLCNLYRLN